jgi:hypothetical protein
MTQAGSPDPCNDLVCITSSVPANSFKLQLPVVSAAAWQRPHLLEFLSLQRNHTIALRCRRVAPSTASFASHSRCPCNVHFSAVGSTDRRNTLSSRGKIDYRPISQRFRGGTRAAEKITLWDSWLRRDSLKAIGRAFGKPPSLFIGN